MIRRDGLLRPPLVKLTASAGTADCGTAAPYYFLRRPEPEESGLPRSRGTGDERGVSGC